MPLRLAALALKERRELSALLERPRQRVAGDRPKVKERSRGGSRVKVFDGLDFPKAGSAGRSSDMGILKHGKRKAGQLEEEEQSISDITGGEEFEVQRYYHQDDGWSYNLSCDQCSRKFWQHTVDDEGFFVLCPRIDSPQSSAQRPPTKHKGKSKGKGGWNNYWTGKGKSKGKGKGKKTWWRW